MKVLILLEISMYKLFSLFVVPKEFHHTKLYFLLN